VNTSLIVEKNTVVVEQGVVRVLAAGIQGPPGGSGPLRTITLAWQPERVIDWTNYDLVRVTLEGTTELTFVGGADGQRLLLELTQDEVGGRTVTWPTTMRFSSTIPPVALSTEPQKLDRFGLIYRATTSTYDVIATALGY
jgi:hypothetical protein